jgi:hypothetical protein
MRVLVEAYDYSSHYLGSGSYYVTLPSDGGGDPPAPIIRVRMKCYQQAYER